jgi:DNA-binding NarL/FixJ family response regulator
VVNKGCTVFQSGKGCIFESWPGGEGKSTLPIKEKKRVIIAEDYTILREGLKALLSFHPNLDIVGEAEDGQAAVRCVDKLKPDLALMDLSMPRMNGLEAIREIKKRSPGTKILVLTVHKAEEYILAALEAGANGYVLKDANHAELTMAVTNVLDGKHYISPGISEKLIAGYLEGKKKVEPRTSWDTLTQREREILKLIAEGYKNRDIADFFCISVKTVEKHRANLMKKLDLHNIQGLTALALEKGLLSKEE